MKPRIDFRFSTAVVTSIYATPLPSFANAFEESRNLKRVVKIRFMSPPSEEIFSNKVDVVPTYK